MPTTIGIIGGSGLYDMAELTDRRDVSVDTPFGPPSAPLVTGRLLGQGGGVPRPARHRPPADAVRAELPRQHLRDEDARRRAHPLGQRGRQPEGGVRAAATWSSRTSSSIARAAASARSSARGWSRTSASRTRSASRCRRSPTTPRVDRRRHRPQGRHLRVHGRAAVLDAGGVGPLPAVGHGHHRDDQPAGGQARPRGGDLLHDDRAGHRLRLLAPDARLGDGGHDHRQPDAERPHRPEGDRRGDRAPRHRAAHLRRARPRSPPPSSRGPSTCPRRRRPSSRPSSEST